MAVHVSVAYPTSCSQCAHEMFGFSRIIYAFANFNGMIPEKFDAVNVSHNVEAEYGNQGESSMPSHLQTGL